MTRFIAQPNADGLVKLTGAIRNLKVTRAQASFVLTKNDQSTLGIVAVAAAIAGMGGQASGTGHGVRGAFDCQHAMNLPSQR